MGNKQLNGNEEQNNSIVANNPDNAFNLNKAKNGMKNINFKKNELTKNDLINKSHFDYINIIGKGGFGKVWKVLHKQQCKIYALKEMSKAKIIDKRSEKSICYERELLSKMKSKFIINMNYAFQDNENVYIILEYLLGGDLRYHLGTNHKGFNHEQTKFFVACIILALEYIHGKKIIHRDLKPENFVLDENGYLKLTDFGIAKYAQKENYFETSGTPGYMAPEVMSGQNHTYAVDYFALGVFCYELMMRKVSNYLFS